MNPPDVSREAEPRHERISGKVREGIDAVTVIMTLGVMVLALFTVYGEYERRVGEERAMLRDQAVLDELRREFTAHRAREASHVCSAFINQAAIEATLLRVARRAQIVTPPPRVLLTPEVEQSCKDASVPVPPWIATVATDDSKDLRK